jgi:hypothetical protein
MSAPKRLPNWFYVVTTTGNGATIYPNVAHGGFDAYWDRPPRKQDETELPNLIKRHFEQLVGKP